MSDPIAPKGDMTAKDLRRSTDRRVVRTRKAIREAFFKLMENQDYHKITIASVAREADIDRKTFSSPAAARRCARMATRGLT